MDDVVIGGLRAATDHFKALESERTASPNQLAAQAAMPKFGRQAKA